MEPLSEGKLVFLIVNEAKEGAKALAIQLEGQLPSLGYRVERLAYEGSRLRLSPGQASLAICLGGDGSVLSAARALSPLAIPIFPINMGHIGFLAEMRASDWENCLEAYRQGRLVPVERIMLQVEVFRDGQRIADFLALNEAAVTASGPAKLISFEAAVVGSGQGSRPDDLGRYRADGLIFATPTGSTAYSLAAGGPILSPDMEAFIFNPISPFTLSNRPVLIHSKRCLELRICKEQGASVVLTLDGQESSPLRPGDCLRLSRSPHVARIIPSGRMSFYDLLRTKLAWHGGSGA